MRVGRAAGWVAVLLSTVGPMVATAAAAPAHTTRVDVSSAGVLGNTAVDEDGIALAQNGNLIAFASSASNLVPGDTNGMRDVFVRNLRTGKTARVDLGPGGVQANGDSFGPLAMSVTGASSRSSPTRPTWCPEAAARPARRRTASSSATACTTRRGS